MRYLRNTTVLAALALFAASGCADLDVTNPNAPDRERALATAGDVESLVAGSFHTWWVTNEAADDGPIFFLSAASFQHSGWPSNFGTVDYSSFPRGEIINSTADAYYTYFATPWGENYSALAAIRDGLRAIEDNPSIAEELGPEAVTRLRAYGKFVQGLATGSIALMYDQGFVIDETQGEDEAPTVVPSEELMQAAVGPNGYFQQAIDIATGATFTTPETWMSRPVDAETLVKLAHSMRARYTAAAARTPGERQAIDWAAVEADVDAGIDSDFNIQIQGFYDHSQFTADPLGYWSFAAWQQLNYFILGMADQSGDYQTWLGQPVASRTPDVPDMGGDPTVIVTPDTRFPQGATLADQIASPGSEYAVPDAESPCSSSAFALTGNSWAHEERGTWRWSYYFDVGLPGCDYENFTTGPWAVVSMDEMRLLKAEADLMQGNTADAAAAVNVTRTANGLDDASDGNDTCVPKLPDGSCGDLMEMLKWEKRLETKYHGLHSNGWYFDGRGWGDLYQGTYLEFPIPEEDLLLLGMSVYTTGSGESAAGTSVYAWPGES